MLNTCVKFISSNIGAIYDLILGNHGCDREGFYYQTSYIFEQ